MAHTHAVTFLDAFDIVTDVANAHGITPNAPSAVWELIASSSPWTFGDASLTLVPLEHFLDFLAEVAIDKREAEVIAHYIDNLAHLPTFVNLEQ